MSWRWISRFRLGGGINANFSRNGIGWSWGIRGLRIGVSGSGRKWISFGIPGTGLYFYKTIGHIDRSCSVESEQHVDQGRASCSDETSADVPDIKWKNIK